MKFIKIDNGPIGVFGGSNETRQQVVARFQAMREADGLRQRLTLVGSMGHWRMLSMGLDWKELAGASWLGFGSVNRKRLAATPGVTVCLYAEIALVV